MGAKDQLQHVEWRQGEVQGANSSKLGNDTPTSSTNYGRKKGGGGYKTTWHQDNSHQKKEILKEIKENIQRSQDIH